MITVLTMVSLQATAQYSPDWSSLDTRSTPKWWIDAKLGISAHWGVYSVPSFSVPGSNVAFAEWYWNYLGNSTPIPDPPKNDIQSFHSRVFGRNISYETFAPDFKAELYNNAEDWAELFKLSGAQYAILTSKHHDGFELWPSPRASKWNSVDVGPHLDLVEIFLTSVRAHGLRAGLYHSIFEWFNPLYRGDQPSQYVDQKLIPDLKDIVMRYKPDDLLVDGEWERDSNFWKTKPFLAWLFNDSPVKDIIAVNDRWGKECRGAHGGYYVCENGGFSDFCDGSGARKYGTTHPWVYWATLADSWGFSRNEKSIVYKSASYFTKLLVRSVVDGGNLLINVGPAADGTIPALQQSILSDIGTWMQVNGEGIYNTTYRSHDPSKRREVTQILQDFAISALPNANNVYGVPAGQSTPHIIYFGKRNNATECQASCNELSACLSYTFHDHTCDKYANMCYGRNDTSWSLVRQSGHFSGRKEFVAVEYTIANDVPVLYAFVDTLPMPGRTLSLALPRLDNNGKIILLGPKDYGNILLPFSLIKNTIQISFPPAAVLHALQTLWPLPTHYKYTLRMEGFV